MSGPTASFRKSLQRIIPFLERRWVLLSFAVVFLGCSVVTVGFQFWYLGATTPIQHRFGIARGNLCWGETLRTMPRMATIFRRTEPWDREWVQKLPQWSVFLFKGHAPLFGGLPKYEVDSGSGANSEPDSRAV